MENDRKYEILSAIKSPKDLKTLDIKDLTILAGELRHRIVNTVSKNGGHLASSLGVVELTIALHYVFDCPDDKLIWDVGHQCYAHKLLTGRNDVFPTLRKEGGVSGFPNRNEGPYDCFNTGHAGTSISAALGFAQARDSLKEDHRVIAVIGDGSMTAGLAFEGLNHAGSLHTNLTVVLNDNKMSISHNVGALSQHLNRIITGKRYVKLRSDFVQALHAVAGDQVAQFSKRLEEAIKGVIMPGRLFEDFGYKYVGPIEGHELSYLIETFQAVKEIDGPKLVHVVTTKGKGYQPAEEKAQSFHGVSPFQPSTGNLPQAKRTYTDVFAEALIELASADDKIVAITAAMPEGTGLSKFAKVYPDRFFDVGIAEQHATTFAAGLAAGGMHPVVAIYSTFLQRVFDQIAHDVCLMNLNVTFAVDRAGLVGEDGATHQGVFDLTYLRCIPNMVVMAPKDEEELKRMLKTAVEHPGPAALRYPRGGAVGVAISSEIEAIPIGRAELLVDGSDLAIIAIGNTVQASLESAERLRQDGFSVAVVNARFVKPLDEEMIEAMGKKCGLLLTVEDNVLAGGFGSAVLELIESKRLPHVAVRRVGIPDVFVEQADQKRQRSLVGIDVDGITRAARELLSQNPLRNSHAQTTETAGHPSL